MRKTIVQLILLLSVWSYGFSQNPIVANKGLNDPHIHIFNDTAYVYASHDKSIKNEKFVMENWWVWSSSDLINWTKRSILKPKDTYIGKEFSRCWATDAAYKNGKYYWYFSEGNEQTGVVVGDSPVGPWKDLLKKPLLNSSLTPTDEYDVCVFEEDGSHYIIFGVWDYYMAKLNDDMMSLAEKPKKISINNPRGPYNLDGSNKEKPTDDKPFLHKYNGKYYLSWGCFYAMSDNLYGPYEYKDCLINEQSFAKGFEKPTWPTGFRQGRHGSFFEWNKQWYYVYCDISQTGNRYFRDSFLSYIHYKENGEIAPIKIDGRGVANYDAHRGVIQAEEYFKAEGVQKKQFDDGFVVQTTQTESLLYYPHVKNLSKKSSLQLNLFCEDKGAYLIEIYSDLFCKSKIGTRRIKLKSKNKVTQENIKLSNLKNVENILISIKSESKTSLSVDSFLFINS